MKRNIVAFDCGNSSLRVVLGQYDGERIDLEIVYQIENTMVKVGDYYYWDVLRIFHELKNGLRIAANKATGPISSIGLCTWGIDYAFFDEKGNMLANMLSYRNEFGSEVLDGISEQDRKSLFFETGILCDKINSLYRIVGMKERMPGLLQNAKKLLMIPDVLGYMFTGEMWNEPSEFSTSHLLDVRTRKLSKYVLNKYGIPEEWFPKISSHGGLMGYLTDDVCIDIGITYKIPIVHVGSHDTASAVVAVPAKEKEFAFISSGTWSLIGSELAEPLINEQVYEAGFTNEIGAMNTITLLKNSAGMFILQRLKGEYEKSTGNSVTWDRIVQMAKGYQGGPVYFDVNAKEYFNPRLMHEAIINGAGIKDPDDWPAMFYAAYNSLGRSYAQTVQVLQEVLNTTFKHLYIVGGGAANAYLNQICADQTGLVVYTGATESTSYGNIGLQLKYFDQSLELEDVRRIILKSIDVKIYEPRKH